MGVNIFETTCKQVEAVYEHTKEKSPETLFTVEVQKAYWEEVRDAHKNGKKLVFFGGPVPIELFYAFDVVPFFLDMLPTRVASDEGVAGRYIDESEKYVPSSMCAIDKVQLGAALLGDYGEKPDAFVCTTVPCDSARIAYPKMKEIFGVPTYMLDIPFRDDERGYKYLASQYDGLIDFFEELTGTKLDWEKFKEVMVWSNLAYKLLAKCADLRKIKPCPLPGRLLVLNEIVACFSGHPACVDYLKAQLQVGRFLAKRGIGACKEERYRVSWLQNMLWSNVGTMDWMEKAYGAILVMDGFGYQDGILFENLDDKEDVFLTLARKATHVPMIHGASGPAEKYVNLVDQIMADYDINVSMFIGHVGCKHTWAAAKIVTDTIQEKFGLPTLYLDVDAIDPRYKTKEEIRATIAEYMESTVGATPLPKPEKKPEAEAKG